MRTYILIAVMVLTGRTALPQSSNTITVAFNGVPTGRCSFLMRGLNLTNGDEYSCSMGAWVKVGPGGGGGNPITGATTNSCVFAASPTSLATPFTTNCISYPSGIPDPGIAPPVSPVTTGGATVSYAIVETNGIGWTLASPLTTITNSAATPNNNITLPVVSDVNVKCYVENVTANLSSPMHACDGSIILDSGPSGIVSQSIAGSPIGNTTIGILFPFFANCCGGFNTVGVGENGIVYVADPITQVEGGAGIQLLDSAGNLVSDFTFQPPHPNAFYMSSNAIAPFYGVGTLGAGGFWENVSTCSSSSSPCTLTDIGTGFEKCDSAGGNIVMNLPATTTFGAPNLASASYGRIIRIHKPKAANTCTIKTTDGTTIDGIAGTTGLVLTQAGATSCLYWDNVPADGNTGMWASCSREPMAGSGTMGGSALAAGACDTPITVTITGARSGMVVEATPEGSPGAGTRTQQWVSSNDTVTAQVCEVVAGTPTSRTYDFRVIQ